jgi:large subunit ribosomal protein L21
MFAVVQIAGSQFRVEKDQTLYVPRIEGKAGDQVEFKDVLLLGGEGKLSLSKEAGQVIKAEILDQVQGDKVIALR